VRDQADALRRTAFGAWPSSHVTASLCRAPAMKKRSAMSARARWTSKDAGGSDAARASPRSSRPPRSTISAGDI
jgi:hypothetical protein